MEPSWRAPQGVVPVLVVMAVVAVTLLFKRRAVPPRRVPRWARAEVERRPGDVPWVDLE